MSDPNIVDQAAAPASKPSPHFHHPHPDTAPITNSDPVVTPPPAHQHPAPRSKQAPTQHSKITRTSQYGEALLQARTQTPQHRHHASDPATIAAPKPAYEDYPAGGQTCTAPNQRRYPPDPATATTRAQQHGVDQHPPGTQTLPPIETSQSANVQAPPQHTTDQHPPDQQDPKPEENPVAALSLHPRGEVHLTRDRIYITPNSSPHHTTNNEDNTPTSQTAPPADIPPTHSTPKVPHRIPEAHAPHSASTTNPQFKIKIQRTHTAPAADTPTLHIAPKAYPQSRAGPQATGKYIICRSTQGNTDAYNSSLNTDTPAASVRHQVNTNHPGLKSLKKRRSRITFCITAQRVEVVREQVCSVQVPHRPRNSWERTKTTNQLPNTSATPNQNSECRTRAYPDTEGHNHSETGKVF